MSTEQLQAIERDIENHRVSIELGDALHRLRQNKDFKKIFSEGYFREEAIRLVSLKADPAMQDPVSQSSIITQIDAIGTVEGYLRVIDQQAGLARKGLEHSEAVRDELAAEEIE